MQTKFLKPSDENISLAGRIIKNGGLVAFPTETVYGLGADATNDKAVKNIYLAKGRPSDNPLIVHIAKKEDLELLVKSVPQKAKALTDAFFPGPLTIILPKSDFLGNTVSGGLDTIAVRMPQNPIARALINASGTPIAAPSANTSGLPSPTNARSVFDDMNGKIDAVIDGGDCRYGIESTVITLAGEVPTILRPGAVTPEMLREVIGEVRIADSVIHGLKEGEVASSPGMKYKHYSPKARIIIVNAGKEKYENFVNKKKDAFALCYEDDKVTIPRVTFGREGDDLSQSHALFDSLRELDRQGAKKAYARCPDLSGVGLAVYNRLIRAAAFCVIDLEKPFLIGLTGQSGSGKSYVAGLLKQRGYNVVDADSCSKFLTRTNSPFLQKLQEAFGDDIVKNGELDRKKLAGLIYRDSSARKRLNALTHPEIIKLCIQNAVYPCVLDAPQLFEAGAQKYCAKTVSVIAEKDIRIKRITKRDGIDKETALARIKAQKDDSFFRENSDFIINNNSDCESVINQIKKMEDEIL